MKYWIALALAAAPCGAFAQITSGPVRVIDGDGLDMAGTIFRLQGIDAPEYKQTCNRNDAVWACGKEAAAHLEKLVASKVINCAQSGKDVYGRAIATCRAGAMDLGRAVIDAGLAIALPGAPEDYVQSEAVRRAMKIGLWGSTFEEPAAYRAANPQQFRAAKPTALLDGAPSSHRRSAASRASGLFFRNCAEARAAGVAPIYRGQPGYRPEMDGDNDGIACEPYRGRR